MPAVLTATLAPRTVGARAREALGSAGVGARVRAALGSAGVGARAREALAASGSGWDRRFRLSLEAQRRRDLRMHPHDLSLFSANQFHLYRLDGRVAGTWPTPRWEWIPAGRIRRPDWLGDVGRFEPLHLHDFDQPRYRNVPTPPNLYFTHMDMNQGYASGKRPASGGNGTISGASGASSAIGAGAAVLALAALVLLSRALERCLDQRFFKLLRRRSDEWFTPNVLATSHHVQEEGTESGPECPDVPPLPPGDPPPPYSMCPPKSPAAESLEPPPPYSACYVAFPHDLPRVHLNVPTPHSFQDTGQITEVAQDSDVPAVTEVPRGTRDGLNTDAAELRPNSDVASQGATVFQIV